MVVVIIVIVVVVVVIIIVVVIVAVVEGELFVGRCRPEALMVPFSTQQDFSSQLLRIWLMRSDVRVVGYWIVHSIISTCWPICRMRRQSTANRRVHQRRLELPIWLLLLLLLLLLLFLAVAP